MHVNCNEFEGLQFVECFEGSQQTLKGKTNPSKLRDTLELATTGFCERRRMHARVPRPSLKQSISALLGDNQCFGLYFTDCFRDTPIFDK